MASENALYNKYNELLQQKGVTTAEVCRETNIDPATMTHWKNNFYTPKADKLVRLAHYFGVPISYFIDS